MSDTELQARVALECRRVMDKFLQVAHHDCHLKICMNLNKFLAKHIYGAGKLVSKHLVLIMSALGLLPSWMSTTSFVTNKSRNYVKLVERFRIGDTPADANMFLRQLTNAFNHPTAMAGAVASKATWIPRKSRASLKVSSTPNYQGVCLHVLLVYPSLWFR
jgi:hypothetical protein